MNCYTRTRLLLQRLAPVAAKNFSTRPEFILGSRVHSRDASKLQVRIIKHFEKTIGAATNYTRSATVQDRTGWLNHGSIDKHENIEKDSVTFAFLVARDSARDKKFNDRNELQKFNTTTVEPGIVVSMIKTIRSLNKVRGVRDQVKLLDVIDTKCCNLVNELSCKDNLILLTTLTEIIPHKITETTFYRRSIQKLKQALVKDSLSKDEMLHLLFLVGFKKKSGRWDVETVIKYLPETDTLSTIEKCIVAQSAYKTGVKLAPEMLCSIEATIKKKAKYLVYDIALLVTLVKVLRQARHEGLSYLHNLSERLVKSKEIYELRSAAHVLALYGEMYAAEESVQSRLVNDSISNLNLLNQILAIDKSVHFSEAYKIQDVDRLLWAASRLNHKLKESQFLEIDRFIKEAWNEFSKKPELFVNTLLSLWMLGHQCGKAIENCFRENIFTPLLNSKHWKYQARLNLLLTCVRIESPEIRIPAEFITEANVGWQSRPTVDRIKCALISLSNHMQLNDIKIDCPVTGLYVPGVSANHSHLGRIHVDVLDINTCFVNTRKPNGLMSLKLRLLKKLGYWSLVLKDDCLLNSVTTLETIKDRINDELRLRGIE